MDATTTVIAISELAKLAMMYQMERMRQAGLTEEQIELTYQAAKAAMLARDPANIPDIQ